MQKRRTTIILDAELLAQAREILRTGGTTDTIHRALRDVIQREKRLRLLRRDFSGLDLQALRRTRASPDPQTEPDVPERGKAGRRGAPRH